MPRPVLDHLLRRVDVVELHHAARHDAGLAKERARQDEVARGAVEEDQPLGRRARRRRSRARPRSGARVDDEHDLVLVERQLVIAACGSSRTSPTCTCSRRTSSRISSEWPVRTIRCTSGTTPGSGGGRAGGRRSRSRAPRRRAARPTWPSPQLASSSRPSASDWSARWACGAERAARGGQPHPARRADEELDAELPLEVLDPGRQRGLRDVEHGRRLADRAALRDGEERLDLGQEHVSDINAIYGQDRRFDLPYGRGGESGRTSSPTGGGSR